MFGEEGGRKRLTPKRSVQDRAYPSAAGTKYSYNVNTVLFGVRAYLSVAVRAEYSYKVNEEEGGLRVNELVMVGCYVVIYEHRNE